MISVEIKDRLRKPSGIWLLLMGVAIIVSGIYGLFAFITGNIPTGYFSFGSFYLYLEMIIPGIILICVGISVLDESYWKIDIACSIILCITLAVLLVNGVYPVISCVCLGISLISTAFLFIAKSEFI